MARFASLVPWSYDSRFRAAGLDDPDISRPPPQAALHPLTG
jgi:hypothetical protein